MPFNPSLTMVSPSLTTGVPQMKALPPLLSTSSTTSRPSSLREPTLTPSQSHPHTITVTPSHTPTIKPLGQVMQYSRKVAGAHWKWLLHGRALLYGQATVMMGLVKSSLVNPAARRCARASDCSREEAHSEGVTAPTCHTHPLNPVGQVGGVSSQRMAARLQSNGRRTREYTSTKERAWPTFRPDMFAHVAVHSLIPRLPCVRGLRTRL